MLNDISDQRRSEESRQSEKLANERIKSTRRKRKIAARVILNSSDVLTMTGISLVLAGIVQNDSLPFYHLHIVYDTASFVL